jgi:hypothetical protein
MKKWLGFGEGKMTRPFSQSMVREKAGKKINAQNRVIDFC